MADETGTPIYDISGDQAVLGQVPHEQVQEAITSGKYSLPKDREISVFSPDGQLGTIPAEEAPDAFNRGYNYATPSMIDAHIEKGHYQEPAQQLLTGIEGIAQGVAGPVATLAEEGLSKLGVPGISAEERVKRQEANPWTHGLSEAGGFIGGMFTGASEAALLGRAGQAVHGVFEGATAASKLAAGAAKMAVELGLYQAGDEASKAINQDPHQTVVSALQNIGLSSVLGGGLGVVGAGIGMGARSIMNNQEVKNFADRFAWRGSNITPDELMQKEFTDAHSAYHAMGSEVGGVDGIGAQARAKLMPKLNEHISGQAQGLLGQINTAAQKLEKAGDKSGMLSALQEQATKIENAITSPEGTSGSIYDTLNEVKKQFGEWARFDKSGMLPLADKAFVNQAKSLGHSLKVALEDEGIWSKVGGLQKSLNSAWSDAIPAMKDAESKFMTKIGGEPTLDPQKFTTYLRQNGRSTDQTIRQKMMGNYIDAVDKFQTATNNAFEKAGVENSFLPVSMNSLKESVGVQSVGSKLADLWVDKIAPKSMGDILGGSVGGALGHATGIPEAGFGGAYLGKWALGPLFSSVIKPLLEKGPNSAAFKATLGYMKSAIAGEHALTNAVIDVFESATKPMTPYLMPEPKKLEKLDEKLKEHSANPFGLIDIAGDMGNYLPGHAQAMSYTAMNAVTYLNSLRPSNPRKNPLDTEIPISKAQMAPFDRALAIAEQPLIALSHVKNGTLLPQDLKTIQTLYPAYYAKMSQELMNAMTDHLAKGGSVPYRLRQSASLFIGQPLDSTMNPESIQSIQMVFAKNKPTSQDQIQPQKGSKGSPSKLGKTSENMMTNDQARAQRMNA